MNNFSQLQIVDFGKKSLLKTPAAYALYPDFQQAWNTRKTSGGIFIATVR
jgi:hypothetical protein